MNDRDWVIALSVPNRRQVAMASLRERGLEALEALLEGVAAADWRVRKWCVAFLAELNDARAAAAVVAALRDPVTDVRRHAISAVGTPQFRETHPKIDVTAVLMAVVEGDPSIQVRRVATQRLGTQPVDPRVASLIRNLFGRELDRKLLNVARWTLEQHQRRPKPSFTRVRRVSRAGGRLRRDDCVRRSAAGDGGGRIEPI